MNLILKLTKKNTDRLFYFNREVAPIMAAIRSSKPPTSLSIDIADCLFLEPQYVVVLACIMESCNGSGIQVSVNTSLEVPVGKYLESIRFYEYWKKGFDRSRYTPTHTGTCLSLWQTAPGMIEDYRNQAKVYFERNFLVGMDLDPLSISMAEIFNNIFDHADSPVNGYTLTQFYPQRKEMVTAVCDFGVGIATTINSMLIRRG